MSCEGGCELSGSPPAEIVRSSDKAGEPVQVNTAELSNKFKFFETYENELAKKAKESRRDTLKRITPPREDGVVKVSHPWTGKWKRVYCVIINQSCAVWFL